MRGMHSINGGRTAIANPFPRHVFSRRGRQRRLPRRCPLPGRGVSRRGSVGRPSPVGSCFRSFVAQASSLSRPKITSVIFPFESDRNMKPRPLRFRNFICYSLCLIRLGHQMRNRNASFISIFSIIGSTSFECYLNLAALPKQRKEFAIEVRVSGQVRRRAVSELR